MVTGGGEGAWQPGKNPMAPVVDRTGLAVHDRGRPDNITAKNRANGLLPQTHPKNGRLPAKCSMTCMEIPASFGEHGPGEMHSHQGQALNVSIHFVIAFYNHLSTEFYRYWTMSVKES